MSYRCQQCRKQTFGPANKVITQVRNKTYTREVGFNRTEVIGQGREIAKELLLCGSCAAKVGEPVLV